MEEFLCAVILDYRNGKRESFRETARGIDAESARLSIYHKYKARAKEDGIEDISVVLLGITAPGDP